MLRRTLIAASSLLPLASRAQVQRALKIAALADGTLWADAKEVDLASLEAHLDKLKREKGVVWYYRENPAREPHPRAMEAIKLIVKYELPVTMSTKPDFSDYVDASGTSKPR
jgi:hypothetical protein